MSKRVCFVSLNNLYLTPYINKYIKQINSEFDVIYWNRHEIDENIGAKNTYGFQLKMDESASKIDKFIGYMKFKKYAINKINSNKYDMLILLQTSVGMLLNIYLMRYFKNRYILDIRDYTMENNFIFYALEKKLIKESSRTVISSKGYRYFLPDYQYLVVHNNFDIDKDTEDKFKNKNRDKDTIVISYIGLIRFHDQNKKFILKLKNDDRFILRFIGKDAYALKDFCEENEIKNVELIDRFPPEKTLEYYYESDIIYNLYGNNMPLLDYALSNKLYYAAQLKMPILVCPKTYMEEIAINNGFGFTFDFDDKNIVEKLYKFYKLIDWHKLEKKCEKFINEINEENNEFDISINKIINNLLF